MASTILTRRCRIALGSRLVKGDELDVEVYWERPDRSKQVIRSWRDSTFFPTDLSYHRDHLGIVSNDFGPMIRIGDGDEVRDVIHPLSPDGPGWYDYRARDTITIASGATRITLVTVEVRPQRPDQPAVAGMLFLDLERATLVRFEFSFTGSAYRDHDLEDITVKLERALVDGRYWLPYRQAIEIRRRSAKIDWPIRGIIRGRWEISDYQLNAEPPVRGPGSWILGLRKPGGPAWNGPLLRTIDSVEAPADRLTLDQVREIARRLVRRRVLDGLPRLRPGVSRAEEFLRVNRVEGIRLGAGLVWRGAGFDRVEGWGAVASGGGRLTGRLRFGRRVGRTQITATALHAVEDVGDDPAVSAPVNSLTAAIGGRDLGDYVLTDRVGLTVRGGGVTGPAVEVGIARERARSLGERGGPIFGRYRSNPPLGSQAGWVARGSLSWDRAGMAAFRGRVAGELGTGAPGWSRIAGRIERTWPAHRGEWRTEWVAGVATSGVPPRRLFTIGGPGSLVGEPFRAFGGRALALVKVERVWSVPGPAVGLGMFGRTEARMLVGPFVAVGGAWGPVAGPWQPSAGLRPVAGLAFELLDRSVRVEIGQAWRGGRGPQVNVDVVKRWWPIL